MNRGFQRLKGRRIEELLFNEYRVSVWDDEKVLDDGDIVSTLTILKCLWIIHLKIIKVVKVYAMYFYHNILKNRRPSLMLQRSQNEISSEKWSFILFCDSEATGDISRALVVEKCYNQIAVCWRVIEKCVDKYGQIWLATCFHNQSFIGT